MYLAARKGGLGMGLEALFDDNSSDVQVKKTLRTSEIEPNKTQPRKDFNEDTIASLAESIKEHGIIQPLLVRPFQGTYQIVAGERRWRAARMLGVDEVPVIIKELSDSETVQIALIENLQRENLNPIEEAAGYKELMDTYGMKQEYLARIVGRSRSSVANSVRLLNLPEKVQEFLKEGLITVGHAKILLGLDDPQLITDLVVKVSEEGLTVRNLEILVSKISAQQKEKNEKPSRKDSYFREMELSLKDRLGRKVNVKDKGNGKGTLVLEFYDKEDLMFLADKLVK